MKPLNTKDQHVLDTVSKFSNAVTIEDFYWRLRDNFKAGGRKAVLKSLKRLVRAGYLRTGYTYKGYAYWSVKR